MLVSTIIDNGRLLADVPNTAFFTDAEALFAVQVAWKEIYAQLAEGGDDYFTTSLYFNSSSLAADANRRNAYTYDLPTDFYRLRMLQYRSGSDSYFPVSKMSTNNFGNIQDLPAYRIVGKASTGNGGALQLYTPTLYQNWCIWYIPEPVVITDATDLVYPNSMVPEIMAYQVAIEIRRKQNVPPDDKMLRKAELVKAMLKQITRDEARAEPIKNVFATGFGPYI